MNWNENLVEEYSSLSESELRLRFASAAASGGLGWLGEETDDPVEWLEEYGDRLRKAICQSESIRQYHSSKEAHERVQLYSMIGDAVMAYFTGIACLVIVELIVRKGLGIYCKDYWAAKESGRLPKQPATGN